MKTSLEYLEYYQSHLKELDGGVFKVAFHHSPKSIWVHDVYPGTGRNKGLEWNHRMVFANEVVIDFDHPEKTENLKLSVLLANKLDSLHYNYRMYSTGGKGYHCHLFFEGLKEFNSWDRKALKEIIIKDLCRGYTQFLDYQLCGNHMVRLELGNNENTYNQKKKEYLHEQYSLLFNKLDRKWIETLEKAKEEEKKIVMVPWTKEGYPPCINFLLNEDFKSIGDGTKRAMFALVSWLLHNTKLSKEEVFHKIKGWDRYVSKQPSTDLEIKRLIEYHSKNPRGVTTRYIHKLLEELGRKNACNSCFKSSNTIDVKNERSLNNNP